MEDKFKDIKINDKVTLSGSTGIFKIGYVDKVNAKSFACGGYTFRKSDGNLRTSDKWSFTRCEYWKQSDSDYVSLRNKLYKIRSTFDNINYSSLNKEQADKLIKVMFEIGIIENENKEK